MPAPFRLSVKTSIKKLALLLSENMFVNETNKRIKEYSPLIVNDKKNDLYYEKILADKIISIQNALFEKLISNKSTNSKLTLDQERFLFIENILYKKNDVSFEKINSNIEKMNDDIISLKNEFSNIDFKDIKNEKQIWTLKSNYEQELYLRGNLAGASDSARVEILASKGGIYMDADILPALKPYNYFMTNNTDEISKNYLKNAIPCPSHVPNYKNTPYTWKEPTIDNDNGNISGSICELVDFFGDIHDQLVPIQQQIDKNEEINQDLFNYCVGSCQSLEKFMNSINMIQVLKDLNDGLCQQ